MNTLIQVIGFSATLAGLFIAIRQLRDTSKVNRARFIFDLTNTLFNDDDIRKFFYKIDYEKFVFNVELFKDSDEERWLDTILYKFDVIGKMVRMKVISIYEIEYVTFEIVQVYKNIEINKYLTWLDEQFITHGQIGKNTRKRPHDDFRWLGETLQNR